MGSDMKQNKFAKVKKYFSFVHLDLHILKLNGSVGIFVFFFTSVGPVTWTPLVLMVLVLLSCHIWEQGGYINYSKGEVGLSTSFLLQTTNDSSQIHLF
jgi:hypothetical protein